MATGYNDFRNFLIHAVLYWNKYYRKNKWKQEQKVRGSRSKF